MEINCTPEVTVLADSTGQHGVRLTTLQLRYWRAIHAEVLTHRAFSRNAGSSRARPTMHFVNDIRTNGPWGPRHWGELQPGMQAHEELPLVDQDRLKRSWIHGALASTPKICTRRTKKGNTLPSNVLPAALPTEAI